MMTQKVFVIILSKSKICENVKRNRLISTQFFAIIVSLRLRNINKVLIIGDFWRTIDLARFSLET